jgi:hypothetical protein
MIISNYCPLFYQLIIQFSKQTCMYYTTLFQLLHILPVYSTARDVAIRPNMERMMQLCKQLPC